MSGLSDAWRVLPAAGLVLAAAGVAAFADAALAPGSVRRPWAERVGVPVSEVARLLRQRRRGVVGSDGLLRVVGCAGPLVIALLMAVVVPFGGVTVADLPVGLVWFNAMDVVLWATWWLAGWGANSAFGLVGGYRFLAQAIAYELPLMFALTTAGIAAGSLRTAQIVAAQHGTWFVVQMPVAALVFVLAVAAFTVWAPFDHPGGRDAAGGLFAELSGIDRLLVLVGRYALLGVGAGMGAALFLGGGNGPLLPAWLWSTVKTVAVLVALVAMRHRGPSLPAERVMRWAWLVVLPLTVVQALVTSVVAATGS